MQIDISEIASEIGCSIDLVDRTFAACANRWGLFDSKTVTDVARLSFEKREDPQRIIAMRF